MKKVARYFALLLIFVLITSTVSAVSPVAGMGEITRREWISQLVETFNMTIKNPDNMPDNYYSDLSADADYYMDIMVAVEFGVIDLEAGYPFRPEDPATREFAAHTLNFCLGFQPPEETISCGDSAELSYPDDVQVALYRGWFALSGGNFLPKQPITVEEAAAMLADAAAVLEADAAGNTVECRFTFAEGVIDATAAEAEIGSDGSVTLHNFGGVIAENDLFIIVLDGYPVALRALVVEQTEAGELRLKVSTDGTDGAITSLSYEGTASADLGTFTPVETTTYEIVDTSAGEDAQIQMLSVEPRGIHYDKNAKTLTASLQLKVDGNSAGSVSVTLRNCDLEHHEEWNSPFTVDYASAILRADVDVNSSITFDFGSYAGLPRSLTIGRVDIIPFVCGVELNVEYDISGGLSLSWTGDMSAGFEYAGGDFRLIKRFEKKEFSFTAEAELRTGLAIAASIDLAAVEGTVRAGAGAAMDFRATTYDSGTPATCVSMDGYLYFDGSVNVRVLSKRWSKAFVIFNKRNSPVRVSYHYEDNVLVTRCTREDEEGGHSRYYTSTSSHYFNPSPSYGQSYTDSSGEPIQIYEYEVEDQYYAAITGYNGTATAIAIPSEIDGYEVRTIGSNAFSGKPIRSVVIPDSVTQIERSAFSSCTSLSSVKLSANLVILESNTFYGCSSLKEIYIPKSLKKATGDGGGAGPFSNSGLTTATFEPGTTHVPQYLFSNAPNLQSVTLLDTITEIGEYAFQYCTSLQNIDIPNSVTLIDGGAFYGCTNLQAIDIPSSVTVIGYNAFTSCTSMKSIIVPDSVIEIKRGAFSDCTSLSSVKLSANLVTLESNAFYGCSSLKEIYIPKSLEKATGDGGGAGPFSNSGLTTATFEPGTTHVPQYLFSNAPNLQSVTLLDTITEIGEYAFQRCTSLQNIDIPNSVTLIDSDAFYGCTNLQAIDIPGSVTVIGYNAFTNCTSLASVQLSEGLTTINSSAFSGCASLASIAIPASMTVINDSTFRGCSSLASAILPKSLGCIDENAFSSTGLTSLTLPDGCKTLGSNAFSNCEALESVTLSAALTSIPSNCFSGCTMLDNVVIPNYVTSIGSSAFANCVALKSITIPPSVTSINANAFSYKDRLIITGVPGTYAQTFAGDNGFSFVSREVAAASAAIVPAAVTMNNGKTYRLQLDVTPADFTDPITWMSSNSSIVTVDSTGLLTAKSAGEADIRAVVGNAIATCHITVVQPVTRISISPSSVTLDALETRQLTANVSPTNAANKAVIWSSSDPAIASVDENGLVTTYRKGTATVTATAADGSGISGSCTVSVNNNSYIVYSASQLASPHPYPVNCSDIWVLTAEGASYIEITFDVQTAFDSFGGISDGLYIFGVDGTPGEDNRYTGTELAGKTVRVSGNTIKLKLDTDGAVNLWGFAVTELKTDGTVDPYAALEAELAGVKELPTDSEKREAVQNIVQVLEPDVLTEALRREDSGVLETLETLEAGLAVQTEVVVEELGWLTKEEIAVTGAVWSAVNDDLPVTVTVGLPEDTETWDKNRFAQVNEFSIRFENAAEDMTIPVRVILPIPDGINTSAIVVFRQRANGCMERVACTVSDRLKTGTAYVSFFVTGAGDYALTQVKNDLSGAKLNNKTATVNVFTSKSGTMLVCATYGDEGQLIYASVKEVQANISQVAEFINIPENSAYVRFFLLTDGNYIPLLESVRNEAAMAG